ncbi:zinc finger protein ZAT1-like [Cornus florida]|uniref:zinc finger protein ZAT1-like n=1 Tax=Cornus florida TaxID=4283 RepID=UPI00289C6E11|nr:zinc finger protein ZAT1-like [Cornus florida]
MVENVDLKGASVMHACKICKKGFRCGGALGGHMRAHSLGDVNGCMGDQQHPMGNVQDKPGGNKRTYYLRTTANRFVGGYPARENCGKKFLTLNSFNFDQNEERVTSMSLAGPDVGDGRRRKECNGIEGKRFRGSTKMGNNDENGSSSSEEEEDLANCLVMLSNGKLDPMSEDAIRNSLALGGKEEEDKGKEVVKGMFQCKACKKVFSSHQALGGHRASHKKVKGCFAARFDHNLEDDRVEEDVITTPTQSGSSPPFDLNHTLHAPFDHHQTYPRKKSKVHECSICHRVFSSGQALGGHKRCHWLNSNLPPDTSSIPNFHDQFQYDSQQLHKKPMFKRSEPLDLNLPALLDDTTEARPNNDNSLNFEAPTRIFLPPRANEGIDNTRNHHQYATTNTLKTSLHDVHGKVDYSTWLQMGITSTRDGGGAIPWGDFSRKCE